jgi:hypothetical protein
MFSPDPKNTYRYAKIWPFNGLWRENLRLTRSPNYLGEYLEPVLPPSLNSLGFKECELPFIPQPFFKGAL